MQREAGRSAPSREGRPGDKQALRTDLRARRRTRVAGRDRPSDAAAIADHVLALTPFAEQPGAASPARPLTVLSYVSLPHEPPTDVLHARLAAAGHRVLVPVTLPSFDLDWRDLADEHSLPLGTDSPGVADVVVAPALAVDASGTRLGQGGGSYDRVLPRLAPGTPVVVLLHPGEVVPADTAPLPREPHDVPVALVVTADGAHEVGPPGRVG